MAGSMDVFARDSILRPPGTFTPESSFRDLIRDVNPELNRHPHYIYFLYMFTAGPW